MSQIRRILVQQMSIPTFLKAKGDTDKVGYVLESVFVALTLGAFASGIWTQITSALHLRSIWWTLEERGTAVLHTLSVARSICDDMERGGRAFRHLAAEGLSALRTAAAAVGNNAISTFGTLLNQGANGIRTVCDWLGKVDVYVTLASGRYGPICVPRAFAQGHSNLVIQGAKHPLVSGCVANDFGSAKPHVILTGPNRGGKSTYCKSVGLAVIFAQTWGFACASRMTWTPFRKIHSALETNGRLGFNSTFEAEIEFAKTVLNSASNTADVPVLVMMDEIFHSTNAVDGVAASKVFLQQLYSAPETVSLLSTHYRELTTEFKDVVAARQLDATEDVAGVLTYSYKVVPGVSDKSSVMEILREKGLLVATPANCGTAVWKEPDA
jgi:DNA mismatch repair ATPase MutS